MPEQTSALEDALNDLVRRGGRAGRLKQPFQAALATAGEADLLLVPDAEEEAMDKLLQRWRDVLTRSGTRLHDNLEQAYCSLQEEVLDAGEQLIAAAARGGVPEEALKEFQLASERSVEGLPGLIEAVFDAELNEAEPVEAHVKEMVLGMLADPTTRDVLVALQPEEVDDDVVSIGEQVRGIQTRRERLVDLYVGGDLEKASYRRGSEELDAELHAAELAFADRLTHNTLVGIPATYEALEELWGSRGIEFQRLLIEAVLEPITVKPAASRGRNRFDAGRLVLVPRA